MTERLYYADPYCREFDAIVQRVDERAGRLAVALDRTAFYPTSGGQPFDTGTLGGIAVLDVIDEDDGGVMHLMSEPASGVRLEPGQAVHGAIDWRRRFDHMQQHTGQHLLSAACDRLFDARTISFHLGATASTIDLARELTREQIAAAEAEANRVIWENRPIAIRFVSAEEAAALPLRKEPARGGTLRLIDVEEFDLSACGGTHVARTGAVGLIATGSVERFKGGQRVEFFCGGRALDRFRFVRDSLAGAVRLLSVLPDEVPAAIERLQGEARDRQRTITALEQELARYRAGELAASAQPVASGRAVLAAVEADAGGLKSLASAITARPGHVAVLVSTSKPALVVVARSRDVAVAANEIVAALIAKFGGRGGGKPDLAQAGGLDTTGEAILDLARSMLSA
jgi:alanyl-tRNA synthetase